MIPMKKASLINGWLFLVVIAGGFVSLLWPVGQFFLHEHTAWQQFREGELVRRLERRVDEGLCCASRRLPCGRMPAICCFMLAAPGCWWAMTIGCLHVKSSISINAAPVICKRT